MIESVYIYCTHKFLKFLCIRYTFFTLSQVNTPILCNNAEYLSNIYLCQAGYIVVLTWYIYCYLFPYSCGPIIIGLICIYGTKQKALVIV